MFGALRLKLILKNDLLGKIDSSVQDGIHAVVLHTAAQIDDEMLIYLIKQTVQFKMVSVHLHYILQCKLMMES